VISEDAVKKSFMPDGLAENFKDLLGLQKKPGMQ